MNVDSILVMTAYSWLCMKNEFDSMLLMTVNSWFCVKNEFDSILLNDSEQLVLCKE